MFTILAVIGVTAVVTAWATHHYVVRRYDDDDHPPPPPPANTAH